MLFYIADVLSDFPSDFEINCSDLESDTLPEDSCESDIVSLPRPITK